LVRLEQFDAGWSEAEALRDVLRALRHQGLTVVVYAPRPLGDKEAVVAGGGSRLLIGPAGGLDATGSAVRGVFLGGVLERLGVQVESVSAGRYKSAPDALTRRTRSEPDREQMEALVRSLDACLVESIADARGMSVDQARGALESGPYAATSTLEAGLADGIIREEEVESACRSATEEPETSAPKFVSPQRWRRLRPRPWPHPWRRSRVAVVRIHGAIIDDSPGFPSSAVAVQAGCVEDLRAVGADPRVGGVVVHVDSRGGSVTASDAIHSAIRRLAHDKPVAAVMGPVAASGGYYVACAADRVFAAPRTLTGSIGVFGLLPTWPALLEKLDVGHDAVHDLALANIMDPSSGLSDDERARIQRKVDELYQLFIELVAQRRGRSRDEIDAVAQGRVWTGADAQTAGLVDELGGLSEAVAWVRERIPRPTEPEPIFPRRRRTIGRPDPLPAAAWSRLLPGRAGPLWVEAWCLARYRWLAWSALRP
jgi:protease-4